MSEGDSLQARIERLYDEERAKLAFAAELERFRAARAANPLPRSPAYRVGPSFGKPNPSNEGADPQTLRWRAHALLSEIEPLVRAANLQSSDDHEGMRSFSLACRLLGLPWAHVQKAIGDVRSYGLNEAVDAWAPFLGPSDQRIVGRVYVAVAADRPGIIKIGFSRNPEKRAKSLSRELHAPICIIHDERGTMLHEWALHQLLFRRSVAPEWYAVETIPDWLFPVDLGPRP